MALELKYTDENGILHINMSPTSSPNVEEPTRKDATADIDYPKFDSINNRFGQYDLFAGKYEMQAQSGELSGGEDNERRSLFRSRYNSIEEELANTPYAFATDRYNRNNLIDITIKSRDLSDDASPSKDIEDDRFFKRTLNLQYNDNSLFGPNTDFLSKSSLKTSDEDERPAFTVTQLIHAQDRYFDLSSKHSNSVASDDTPKKLNSKVSVKTKSDIRNSAVLVKSDKVTNLTSNLKTRSAPGSAKQEKKTLKIPAKVSLKESDVNQEDAFRILSAGKVVKAVQQVELTAISPSSQSAKNKKESSFSILAETSISSRPSSPRSLPVESKLERVSPFRGRGFREETSRHNTPRTSRNGSRANSPPRRRTNSLSRIDKMATATMPPPQTLSLSRPHSPRNFVKENIEEVREISEFNREKHEAEAEQRRREEEEALLKEMGIFDKSATRSVVGSRNTSRSNSPSKINLRSRSNSPSAILHYENIEADSREFINRDDGMSKPVTHRSRLRSVSRSQPQSNNGSPKHSKIPKRQNSVSPPRQADRRDLSVTKKPVENNLNKKQKFISNSTSSLHDSIKIGGVVSGNKAISKSSQHLTIAPNNIRGKPPISPGRGGPPPSNRTINSKRLSPIVGTPNKSPVENLKPASAKTPTKATSPAPKKPVKTAGNTPVGSRLTSRQPSRAVSPDKKVNTAKSTVNTTNKTNKAPVSKPINRTPSTRTAVPTTVANKPDAKKPINRTSSQKSLVRTPSTKTLNEKPPILKKRDSKKDLTKTQSNTKMFEAGEKKEKVEAKDKNSKVSENDKKKDSNGENATQTTNTATDNVEDKTETQDSETQYDSITNEKGELVTLTKKNVVSMTTAAITAQPLEVVTTVTNQLPAALEKAREKGIFERHSSKDSLAPKELEKPEVSEINNTDDKKASKPAKEKETKNMFSEDNIKMKPLQPPYNNPQVERVKQKIDDILKTPEVSTENILNTGVVEIKETKNNLKDIANKAKNEAKEKKEETAKKIMEIKDELQKESEKASEDIRTEVTKIVDSIITPVEQPGDVKEKKDKENPKKQIEPIVMIVNEKKKRVEDVPEVIEKVNETLVKGEAEVEVQSSNVSTPVIKNVDKDKMAEESATDHSSQSNGGFPQSTSTTPKPPIRTKKPDASLNPFTGEPDKGTSEENEPGDQAQKPQNMCQRLMGKCAQKSKCCTCCVKPEVEDDDVVSKVGEVKEKKTGMSKWSCCKKKEAEVQEKVMREVEMAAGKVDSIEFENESKRKRSLRDVFCGCCAKRHRVGDSASEMRTPSNQGCCGRGKAEPEIVERRDSILSDRPPRTCCNNRLCNWFRGACRRNSEQSSSRRTSMFSKNKSLSPTLPPEDTRPKLDPTLVEHTSVIRGAIPVLPISLAYFCLICNVIVPGLGTIFSGMFCLCFGIPRFGIHDGAKHRIGALLINLLVGCGQLFTVLFCLVGWGWSIWWGVIMIRVSRKYRKLAAEAAAEEEQSAPPVTANNHHSRA